MMLICLACDREYDGPLSHGYCVLCTMENFRANGISVSITELVSMGAAICKHPELIVRLSVK